MSDRQSLLLEQVFKGVVKRPNVRFGSKADMCGAQVDVRFTPESDAECVHSNFRYGPIADSCAASTIDQLVGAFEHGRRDSQTERSSGL